MSPPVRYGFRMPRPPRGLSAFRAVRWPRRLTLDSHEGCRTREAAMADLLTYLALHVGRYEWKVLTTEQKNLWADLIDEHRAREYPNDFEPMERWWQ